ncbi:MAG: methyltransferase [Chlorobi bacterium]|nr:methyltransferase [Chlorobiota bacterium]
MMTLPPDLERYIEQFSAPLPPILDEIERDTWLKTPYPQMLSGKIQAGLLGFLTGLVRPRRILEIGTFTGYATLAMASAMPPDAMIDTVESDPVTAEMARSYFERTPWNDRIRLHLMPAARFLEKVREPYDLIFLDADKENYPLYYKLLKPLLSPRGLWITDNVLWSGKVLAPRDPASRGIHYFNELVARDKDLTQTIVPVRDGLMLIRLQ